jgi:hypothetical protein
MALAVSSDDHNGHCFASPNCNRDVLDTNGDRVTPDNAFMKYFHPRTFDEAEFDQAAFEFDRRQRGAGVICRQVMDGSTIATLGQSQRHLCRVGRVANCHHFVFSTTGTQVKLGMPKGIDLRAILNWTRILPRRG